MKELTKDFLQAINGYQNILLYIKGSPDPDAIASSYALKAILEKMKKKATIVAEKDLSLSQNKAFVKLLNIPVVFNGIKNNIDTYDSYIIVDHQSAHVEGVSERIPCIIHLDHHELVHENLSILHKYVNQDAGSVSTLLGLLLRDLNLDFTHEELRYITTALMYGIETDTDKFEHSTLLDYNSLTYLSQYSDSELLKKISDTPFSKQTILYLWKAMEHMSLYKDWIITGIGYVKEKDRDSIAIIADFLLKRETVSTVIVFAIIENADKSSFFLDASFRTVDDSIDLNTVIKRITDNGGARKHKGALQVDLSYFKNFSNKDLLWNLVKQNTVEVIEKSRDRLYMKKIHSVYNNFKKVLKNLFG